METKIIKASSIDKFYQPSTNNHFHFGRGWMIYVEGFGYLGIFDTKKKAQQILDTNPDFSSYRDDVWFQIIEQENVSINTLGDLRKFMKMVQNLPNDTKIIGDYYLGSFFEGFTINGNEIIAETCS